jgi:hypothetical protein
MAEQEELSGDLDESLEGRSWEEPGYDQMKFYTSYIRFTPTGEWLEREIDGYLLLSAGIPLEVQRRLRALKDRRYYPVRETRSGDESALSVEDTKLIEGLRDRAREAALQFSKHWVTVPGLREGDPPIKLRPCLPNRGAGTYDTQRGTYRRR